MLETPTIDRASNERLADMLANSSYMTMATVSNEQPPRPSTTTVAYAFAKVAHKYYLFWLSSPDANHSRHIARNAFVAAEIYDQSAPQGTGFKIKLEGPASLVDGFTHFSHMGYEALKDKLSNFPECLAEVATDRGLRRLYALEIDTVGSNIALEFAGKRGWVDKTVMSSTDIMQPTLERVLEICRQRRHDRVFAS